MSLVVDASVALAWCFEDEASPQTDAVLDQVRRMGAAVPGLWHLELASVLVQAERRGRPIVGGIVARLELIAQLPVATDSETPARAFRETLAMPRGEGLTLYDAAYLELSVRRGLALATRNEALREAANRVGVALMV